MKTLANPISVEKTSLIQQFSQVILTSSAVRSLAELFSSVMDERITPAQSLCIVNAFLALLFTVFSFGIALPFRALCLVWLFLALRHCKNAGLGYEESANCKPKR